MKEAFERYLNQRIVIDTKSAWIYIGTLEEILSGCVKLSEVDAHNNKDVVTSKELYVLESKKTGIKVNRNLAFVSFNHVVSFSPLEDIKYF